MRIEPIFKNSNIIGLLSAVDLSTASITSSAIGIEAVAGFSISMAITGSPVGAFKLQGSNDTAATASIASASWDDISGASQTVTAATQWTWNVRDVFFRHIRIVWTKTSGTGTITVATFSSKS